MKEFILDKNVDLKPDQQEYPKYFFDGLRGGAAIRLVVGGTEYRKEVKDKASLLELIGELISSGKVRSVSDEIVDGAQVALSEAIANNFAACPNECDDHHIFALARVSGCMNVITKETRMATCRNKIRGVVGHDVCPNIRIVRTKAAYDDTN